MTSGKAWAAGVSGVQRERAGRSPRYSEGQVAADTNLATRSV